jgi:hypothetical protein
MQQTVTLTESAKKTGNNAKGAWFFYTFKDAGGNKWQTGFNDNLGAKLTEVQNQSITLTYHEEERGNFTNYVIDSFEVGGSSEGVAQVTHAHSAPTSVNSKDESIARAVAFKGAIELAAAGVLDPDPHGITDVAEFFEGYLLNGNVDVVDAGVKY